MANHKSSKKRARQTPVREARNRSLRSEIKTLVRNFREAVSAGNADNANKLLTETTRAIRKAGSKGLFPKRTVDRKVSRLVIAFNKLS